MPSTTAESPSCPISFENERKQKLCLDRFCIQGKERGGKRLWVSVSLHVNNTKSKTVKSKNEKNIKTLNYE